ncbi:MAG: hypothetical protein MUF04_06210, partial [Akkermansiaceae bacterium]|nr:hypothetical protein [Akkermansiaceae bacterium]
MKKNHLDWEQIAARIPPPADVAETTPPPADLTPAVLSAWQRLRQDARVRRWVRWSVLAAVAAAAATALAFWHSRRT